MNISQLRYVVALTREKHFGRAASTCFVSQPTQSVAVKKLEEELGVPLFERARHEVRIISAGERVIEKAQRALEAIESVRQVAQTESDQRLSPLRIGAIFTVGPYLFPNPHCGADMRIVAFITEVAPVRRILTHIGEPAEPPRIGPARGPPGWDDAPVDAVPDWDALAQPQPEYVFDQRVQG